MNTPFTLELAVEEVNRGAAPTLDIDKYLVRTTLSHTIADIKGVIWRQSENYRVKPIFVSIYYDSRKLYDEQKLGDILGTSTEPQSEIRFRLVIDYLLYNLPVVPVRDPPEELFDVLIQWEDNRGKQNQIHIRETIDCTIGTLQDYISEERSRSLSTPKMNREYFGLVLQPSGDYICDSSKKLRDVVGLDVPPLLQVVFRVRFNLSEEIPFCRFHIKINSDVPQLQHFNLIEVNNRTTVQELKQQLISQMDESSVRRTFVEQIELSYAAHVLANTPAINQSRLYDVLSLDLNILYEHGNIITMDLRITAEDGILSRLFWNDLRSSERFEFLPTRTTESEPSETQPNLQTEPQPLAVEPMKIVLDTGEEWQLTGESYEMIKKTHDSRGENIHEGSSLLVNQSDLSSMMYDFSLDVGGTQKTVLLNTSQCIIVNKGDHPPYVLLSPAGIAKLDSVFRDGGASMIQQVRVLLHPTEQHRNPAVVHIQNEHLGEVQNNANQNRPQGRLMFNIYPQLRNHMRGTARRALTVLRYAFILHLIGIDILLLKIWQEVVIIGILVGTIYVLFFSGTRITDALTTLLPERDNEADRQYDEVILAGIIQGLQVTNSILDTGLTLVKNELIMTAVKRTREFDLLMNRVEGNDTYATAIGETFTNLWKDVLLYILASIPRLQSSIEESIEVWRQTEIDDLDTEVKMFQELIITIVSIYDKKNDISNGEPARNLLIRETSIDYELIPPAGTLEETEVRYQQLLQYYIKMQPVYEKFDRCVRQGAVLEEGRRLLDDEAESVTVR